MAYTYSKIASYTVGSGGVSNVDLLAIPQNYTDLVLKMSIRHDQAFDQANIDIRFNYDFGSNYSVRRLRGTGSATNSDSISGTSITIGYGAGDTLTANTFGNAELYIPNYTGSNYKSLSGDAVTENNATAAWAVLQAGLWSNTAAINSISIICGGKWKQYSTFTLYGVKAEV